MTVHRMLRDAVRWGRIARNPADMSDPPRSATRSPRIRAWPAATLRTFLELTRGDELWPLWLMMATTGLRRREALGLRWCDIDFDSGRARVTQTVTAIGWEIHHGQPKTAAGRRPVALDPATIAVLAELRNTVVRNGDGLVFCGVDGEALHPERVYQAFKRVCEAAPAASDRVARATPHVGDNRPRTRSPSASRAGTARAFEHRHHAADVLACDAHHA